MLNFFASGDGFKLYEFCFNPLKVEYQADRTQSSFRVLFTERERRLAAIMIQGLFHASDEKTLLNTFPKHFTVTIKAVENQRINEHYTKNSFSQFSAETLEIEKTDLDKLVTTISRFLCGKDKSFFKSKFENLFMPSNYRSYLIEKATSENCALALRELIARLAKVPASREVNNVLFKLIEKNYADFEMLMDEFKDDLHAAGCMKFYTPISINAVIMDCVEHIGNQSESLEEFSAIPREIYEFIQKFARKKPSKLINEIILKLINEKYMDKDIPKDQLKEDLYLAKCDNLVSSGMKINDYSLQPKEHRSLINLALLEIS